MKKFLSVALSLVMLFTATTFNGNAVERPQKGEPQVVNIQARYGKDVNLNEQKQGKNKGPKEGACSSRSKASGNVVNYVSKNKTVIAAVGGAIATGLVAMNATRNKKLDAAALQENWNNPNKSAVQKYFDAMKILLFGDKTRKNLQKSENERNKQQKRVDDLTNQRETAEEEKKDAEAKLKEANDKKNKAGAAVELITKGGKDREEKDVKGLDTLKKAEKTAQETLANATKARKDAEKNLNTAVNEQKKAEKEVNKAQKDYNAKKAKFEKIDNVLGDENKGATKELRNAQNEYKEACEKASGWEYNKETGKCEPLPACGKNFNRNGDKCECDTTKFDLTSDGQCLKKCKGNEVHGKDGKCVACAESETALDNKCVGIPTCKTDERLDESKNICVKICSEDYQIYNEKTDKCECKENYTLYNGKCELMPDCDKNTQHYEKESNKCVCAEGYKFKGSKCVQKKFRFLWF